MTTVSWVLVVLSALVVAAIAFGSVGREARRLDAIAPRAVYQLDDAAAFVAERIPPDSQGRLTPGEVESLLIVHLRWLHDHGLQPDNPVDRPQSDSIDVTITDDALVATLLAQADAIGVALLDDVDAVRVVDAHLEYFETIGAVGEPIPLDDRL